MKESHPGIGRLSFATTYHLNGVGSFPVGNDENGFSVVLPLAIITDRHHCEPAAKSG
jgi:hypothetical protein